MVTKLRANMTQMDFFDETLLKKIDRLEKWMIRLQKQMNACQEDLLLARCSAMMRKRDKQMKEFMQEDMFVG